MILSEFRFWSHGQPKAVLMFECCSPSANIWIFLDELLEVLVRWMIVFGNAIAPPGTNPEVSNG
jgi:hypothetical protein